MQETGCLSSSNRACRNNRPPQSHAPSRAPSVVFVDGNPEVSLDSNNEYRLERRDGITLAITKNARMQHRGNYVTFSGHGYQVSYPAADVSKLTRVISGTRRAISVFQDCADYLDCCDPLTGNCKPPTDWPGDTMTIDFRVYGGSEVCDYSPSTEYFECGVGGFALPNIGDGFKGNVVKSFTWSITRQDAELACNPASFTSKTRGKIEYTEFRPGALPAFTVVDTGELEPNSEPHLHFHPAFSAASEATGPFLYVWPSVGLAAICGQAPPVTIP